MENDRLKFRVAIKCNSCGVAGFQYWEWNGQQFIEDGYDCCKCASPSLVLNSKPEQCTGLKDKNGKLIFEGDIVSGSNGSINGHEWPYTMTIKSITGGFLFPAWAYDKEGNHRGDSTHYVNIIGNVHEVQE